MHFALHSPAGVYMRDKIRLSILFTVIFFVAVWTSAQEKSTITVKSSLSNNGVVVVDIVKAGKSFELQCNVQQSGCTVLQNGKYSMVELPPNFGMYECKNVEIYLENDNSLKDKLGQYCLIEK